MSLKRFLIALVFPLLFLTATSCDLLDSETDLEKDLKKIAQEWIVDSVRVREYGFIPGTPAQFPLAHDTLLPIIRLNFVSTEGTTKDELIQTSMVDGAEVETELFWSSLRTDYVSLFYYNPNTADYSVEVIYDIEKLSASRFHLTRSANLVADNGAQYGRLDTDYYMHR
jgi:hypothetical protein